MKRTCLCLMLLAGLARAGAAATKPDSAAAGPRVPGAHDKSYIYDLIDQSVIRPITRTFDAALIARKIGNAPREAADVDDHDQVRLPSTWWQPRIGFRTVTVDQMMKGPGPGTGPAPVPWTITRAKSQGVSPGFQIKDSKGQKFVIKFDPPQFPESATGADVIGSYLFWAAGYNVPENSVAYFKSGDLQIAPDAVYTDSHGAKKKMNAAYLGQMLAKVARQRDGSYRCMASRYLSGKPLGPFEYSGRCKDDPEDLVPHELRRELRGLWAVAAWVNHADARGANTLDMWETANGRSFVRHYLIDFGSILGSSAIPIQRDYSTGAEYYVDYRSIARELPTLGLWEAKWEGVVDPQIAAVGFVEGDLFDPGGWRPDYPNPAFDEKTPRDARWGTRIVAAFTDEHIKAAVAAARYTDPRASDYLVQVLIQRRDKLVHHWLGSGSSPIVTTP